MAVLREGGIDVDARGRRARRTQGPLLDGPCRVLVPEGLYERALEVLEDEDDEDDDE